jgi:hypothetical protein
MEHPIPDTRNPSLLHPAPSAGPPMIHDLCLAWNWEHDADFARLLEGACQQQGVLLLQVTPQNLADVSAALDSGTLAFRALLDRASDDDPQFMPLVDWARENGVLRINAYEQARHAWNKAAMHREFLTAGLHVPPTLILPPHGEQADLPPPDLSVLGPSFSIKPACRGGGEGVINCASSWSEVVAARPQYPADPYLLQANVEPAHLQERPAWFRIVFCAGRVYPCWWDVHTHVYLPVSVEEEIAHGLSPLRHIVARIAAVCGLELFSTEIALTAGGEFIAIDYVNDPLDLRLQSKAADGVPDDIVRNIAEHLARWVKGDG